jgi:HEAT repeat protein
MYLRIVTIVAFVILLSCGCEREQGVITTEDAKPQALPSENASLEKLFARMVVSKIPHNHYDHLAPEIAAYGDKAFDVCAKMLKCSESKDSFKKHVAIKALALINDSRAIPLLKEAALKEKNHNALEEEILAVLTLEPTVEQADWAALIIAFLSNPFDQESGISYLCSSSIPAELKLQICSHMDSYKQYGKHAVLRALPQLEKNHAAFSLLKKEVLKHDGDTFVVAVREMARLTEHDPRPVLIEALKESLKRRKFIQRRLVLAIGQARCEDAIPLLEKRFSELSDTDMHERSLRVSIAGTLCRLGHLYDDYAEIVRDALTDKKFSGFSSAAYDVVAWLGDEKTIQILCAQLVESPAQKVIEKLGETGSPLAVKPLIEVFCQVPVPEKLFAIAEAIRAIADKSQSDKTKVLAENVRRTAVYVDDFMTSHARVNRHTPEQKRENFKSAVNFVKNHREFGVNLVEKNNSFDMEGFSVFAFLRLVEETWQESYIPALEKFIKSDTRASTLTTKSGKIVPHYHLRSQVAALLAKKTGREYIYIDADGVTRKGGESPP